MEHNHSTVYISGSSRGLGKALAEQFLDLDASVFGMSRQSDIEHSNYIHHYMDLSNLDDLLGFELLTPTPDHKQLILVNNAARLGTVKPFEQLSEEDILKTTQLNFIAPLLLIKKFLKLPCNEQTVKYVLNIGTGAAQSPMDGWSMYCSTKAGLLMFARVLHKELEIGNSNCRIVDLAPGIIDTNMQAEIREAEQKDFSQVEKFKDYNEDGDLQSAEETASLIIRNFESLFNKHNPSDSIRNYT